MSVPDKMMQYHYFAAFRGNAIRRLLRRARRLRGSQWLGHWDMSPE
jgi:hypothetical protein